MILCQDVIISGCSTDIDKWGIEWPSTVAGNNATYYCYMSTGIHHNAVSCNYVCSILCIILLCTYVALLFSAVHFL